MHLHTNMRNLTVKEQFSEDPHTSVRKKNPQVSSAGFSKGSPPAISYGEFHQNQLYSHSVCDNSHQSALYSFHMVNFLGESSRGIPCVSATGISCGMFCSEIFVWYGKSHLMWYIVIWWYIVMWWYIVIWCGKSSFDAGIVV